MNKILKVLTACYIICMITMISCSKSVKSYEELKRDEKRIINRIIAEKNLEILKNFPSDGVFKDNQFVELKSGVYLNVVDSGTGNRAIPNSTLLLVRAKGEIYASDSVIPFDTFANGEYPMEFKYGSAYTVVNEHSGTGDMYYMFFGMALQQVLEYVGDSAVVKLIVPAYAEISDFQAGSMLQVSDAQGTGYIPIYYDKIKYIFY